MDLKYDKKNERVLWFGKHYKAEKRTDGKPRKGIYSKLVPNDTELLEIVYRVGQFHYRVFFLYKKEVIHQVYLCIAG